MASSIDSNCLSSESLIHQGPLHRPLRSLGRFCPSPSLFPPLCLTPTISLFDSLLFVVGVPPSESMNDSSLILHLPIQNLIG